MSSGFEKLEGVIGLFNGMFGSDVAFSSDSLISRPAARPGPDYLLTAVRLYLCICIGTVHQLPKRHGKISTYARYYPSTPIFILFYYCYTNGIIFGRDIYYCIQDIYASSWRIIRSSLISICQLTIIYRSCKG